MSINQPLFPTYGTGQTVTPTNPATAVTVLGNNKQLVLTVPVASTQVVYVRVTSSTDTSNATAADYLILPGMQVVISKPESHNRVSCFAAAAGSTVHILPCEGY